MADNREVTIKEWEDGWEKGDIGFHMPNVNSTLQKQLTLLIGDKDPSSVRVFIPLCGKTLDLVWLYKTVGCTTVGLEAVEKAIVDFQAENNIKLESKTAQFDDWSPTVYETEDKRLKFYVGDMFEFLKADEKKFDLIFDRGSFVAINLEDRSKYMKILTNILKPESHWLIEGLEYDASKFQGPPHIVSKEFIDTNLGNEFDIEVVHEGDFEKKHLLKLDYMIVRYFLLKKTA